MNEKNWGSSALGKSEKEKKLMCRCKRWEQHYWRGENTVGPLMELRRSTLFSCFSFLTGPCKDGHTCMPAALFSACQLRFLGLLSRFLMGLAPSSVSSIVLLNSGDWCRPGPLFSTWFLNHQAAMLSDQFLTSFLMENLAIQIQSSFRAVSEQF